MDRFNELERTWEERRKKRKLVLTATGGGVLLLLAVYFTMPVIRPQAQPHKTEVAAAQPAPEQQSPKETARAAEPVKPAVPATAAHTPEAAEPVPVKEAPKPVADKTPPLKDPLTITLDRSFEDQIDTDLERYARQKTEEESTPVPSRSAEPSVSAHPDTEDETPGLQIKSETVDDSEKIGLLIDNYEFDQTYENAMKITRHYFASQDYPNAIQWSLKANQLDSADDESWLIFAKASIAVGEGEQAKKALQTYLQKRDSIRVRQLYQTIK